MRAHLPALLLFAALTGAMLWPLPGDLRGQIAGDARDPLLNAWILAWDFRALARGEVLTEAYWNGSQFFPHERTLTYAEHLLGPALLAFPLFAATGDVTLSYNVLILASFWLAAAAAYFLAHEVGGDRLAAAVAGIVFAFCPFRMAQLYHVHIEMTFPIPLAFLGLERWLRHGRRRALAGAALWLFAAFLCSFYVGLFALVGLAVRAALAGRRLLARRSDLAVVAVLALGLFLALRPSLLPYIGTQKDMGLTREVSEASRYSAEIQSFLASTGRSWLYGEVTRRFWRSEGFLFLGIAPLAALVLCARKGSGGFAWGILAAAGAVLSLGPEIRVSGISLLPGPYRLLALLPGFDGVRVPSRFHMVTSLAVAVLLAARLAAWRRSDGGRWLPIALLLALPLEYAEMPIETQAVPPPIQEAKPRRRLPLVTGHAVHAALDAVPGDEPYVELPLGGPELGLRYLWWNMPRFRPMVNGSSGFEPPAYEICREVLVGFPDGASLELLEKLGVPLVVAHRPMLPSDPDASPAARDGRLVKLTDAGEAAIYRLPGSRPLPPAPADTGWLPGRLWSEHAGTAAGLALDEPADVTEIALLFHRLAWHVPRQVKIEIRETLGSPPEAVYEGAVWRYALPGLVRRPTGFEARIPVRRRLQEIRAVVTVSPPGRRGAISAVRAYR